MSMKVSSLLFVFSMLPSFLLPYRLLRRNIFGQKQLKPLSSISNEDNQSLDSTTKILDNKAKLLGLDKTKYHMYVYFE